MVRRPNQLAMFMTVKVGDLKEQAAFVLRTALKSKDTKVED